MFVVKKSDFSRDFNSSKLLQEKQKEVKKWQIWILLGCFLLQMFPYCVALNLTTVFVPTDWTIWTQGDQSLMSITFTVGAVGAALVGPLIARLFSSKINMRVFYSIGVFLGVLGFFGSCINTFVPFDHRSKGVAITILYVSNFVSQAGVMIFSGLGVNNLISKWWPPERRGFALGLAFTGGSIGNIWMQQLVNALAQKFGNNLGYIQGELPPDLGGGQRWVTYLILSSMGLIMGILIVMFICRKPVPPTDIFGTTDKAIKAKTKHVGSQGEIDTKALNQSKYLEASPLVTRKYPIYWILAFGYLVLQMGTVHAALNGTFIKNATQGVVGSSNDAIFNNVMAVGGTLFGVFCLVGNFGGGILNDKIGPNKSIAIAGIGQVAAMLCLMASVKMQALAYAYFILAGLSVYIYTSTPAYLCGRLYGAGQSNNHMAILGIFVALGYAISNSIIGSITGSVTASNTQYLLGEKTYGNMAGFIIFALSCMAIGTIIVVICSTIIMRKGVKGLLSYSPTKYSRIITFKHNFINKLSALRILITHKDFRKNNAKRLAKINKKLNKDKTYKTDQAYLIAVTKALKNQKLSKQQLEVLAFVYENQMVASQAITNILKVNDANKLLTELNKKKLIKETELANCGTFITIEPSFAKKLEQPAINNKITDDNQWLLKKLASIEAKTATKIAKIETKIATEQQKQLDNSKQVKYLEKSKKLIKKDLVNKDKIFAKSKQKSDWKAYKAEYSILHKLYQDQELKNKLQVSKEEKLAKLNKKIFVANFIKNYNTLLEINGHNLLVHYYNNIYSHCDELIDQLIENSIENKINKILKTKENLQKKYDKELALENKLVNQD